MIRGILSESLQCTTVHPAHTGPGSSPAHSRKPNLLQPRVAIGNTASHRFLFSNFRYSFTLFSKFFASFPHGTCSLSVSHQYLALDGIYHPLRAAIPNNSTRRKQNTAIQAGQRGYHPQWRSFPEDFTRPSCFISLLQTTSPKILRLSSSRFTRRY